MHGRQYDASLSQSPNILLILKTQLVASSSSTFELLLETSVFSETLDLTMMQVDMKGDDFQPIQAQLAQALRATVHRERDRVGLGQRYAFVSTSQQHTYRSRYSH